MTLLYLPMADDKQTEKNIILIKLKQALSARI
jgi:hypothetical protein